jgi:hypothetical protein
LIQIEVCEWDAGATYEIYRERNKDQQKTELEENNHRIGHVGDIFLTNHCLNHVHADLLLFVRGCNTINFYCVYRNS